MTCSIPNCDRESYARGWCKRHYTRWNLRGGDPGTTLKSGRKPGTVSGRDNPGWRGGVTRHPLYDVYHEMIGRCHRESHSRYGDYGGRGIRVCEEWRADFWKFVDDVGERPEGTGLGGRATYSLDRVDNDKGYQPGNTRWASPQEQARNKRGFGDFESRRDPVTGRFK